MKSLSTNNDSVVHKRRGKGLRAIAVDLVLKQAEVLLNEWSH